MADNDRIFISPFPLKSLDYKALLKGQIESREHDDLPDWCKELFVYDFQSMNIVGSCNGLICLGGYGNFFLWNPHTKEFHQLPKITLFLFAPMFYGFGYDSTTDDYKIVLGGSGPTETFIAVFSLKLGSWKTFQGLDYFDLSEQGCYFNGALHWSEFKRDDDYYPITETSRIVSFDLADEKFKVLVSLSNVIIRDHVLLGIGSTGNCLFVGVYNFCHDECPSGMAFTIWVMKDYGVKNSWAKFMEIPSEGLPFVSHILPISMSENGEVLMLFARRTFALYNPEEKTYRVVFEAEAGAPMLPCPVTYVETLVSPKTGRGPAGEQTSETILMKETQQSRLQVHSSGSRCGVGGSSEYNAGWSELTQSSYNELGKAAHKGQIGFVAPSPRLPISHCT